MENVMKDNYNYKQLGTKCVRLTLPLCNAKDLQNVYQHLANLVNELEPIAKANTNQAMKISHARYVIRSTQYKIKDLQGKVYDAV